MKTRVLIVDDSQPMREMIKMTLAGVAEVVGECADGADALAEYKRLQPDWVLMDIEMKGIDGITATGQIIAADALAKILVITDYNDSEMRKAALEARCLSICRQRKFALYIGYSARRIIAGVRRGILRKRRKLP